MATHEVKLAARNARLKLDNDVCKVIIKKASETTVFITKPGIFKYEDVDSIRIPNERIVVPITDITKIEMSVSIFTPDKKCWMEVDW